MKTAGLEFTDEMRQFVLGPARGDPILSLCPGAARQIGVEVASSNVTNKFIVFCDDTIGLSSRPRKGFYCLDNKHATFAGKSVLVDRKGCFVPPPRVVFMDDAPLNWQWVEGLQPAGRRSKVTVPEACCFCGIFIAAGELKRKKNGGYCGKCRSPYCSDECRRNDWAQHKKECERYLRIPL